MSKGTVLVTGASSGIGAEFARRLAKNNYDIILIGRRREKLEAVAAEVEAAGSRALAIEADLADPAGAAAVERLAAGTPDLAGLINNAGFGLGKSFLESGVEAPEAMLRVHDQVPLRLCRAALPGMLARGGGFIINVSSLAAFAPVPGDAVYSATKAFLNCFSESLHMAYADKGLSVQALCPGFTRTDFHAKLGLAPGKLHNRGFIRWMSAARVVDVSLRELGRTVVCIPGAWNRLLYRFLRLLPRGLYYRLMKAMYGVSPIRADL